MNKKENFPCFLPRNLQSYHQTRAKNTSAALEKRQTSGKTRRVGDRGTYLKNNVKVKKTKKGACAPCLLVCVVVSLCLVVIGQIILAATITRPTSVVIFVQFDFRPVVNIIFNVSAVFVTRVQVLVFHNFFGLG